MEKMIVEERFLTGFGTRFLAIEPGTGTRYGLFVTRIAGMLNTGGQLGSVEDGGYLVINNINGAAWLFPAGMDIHVETVQEHLKTTRLPDLYYVTKLLAATLKVKAYGLDQVQEQYREAAGRPISGSDMDVEVADSMERQNTRG